MAPKILLVNPPIYDFSAYDYWLKPYGLLRVAGCLRGRGEIRLFDYLDRRHPSHSQRKRSDAWGRGEFDSEIIPKPAVFAGFPRRYRRFGLRRSVFQEFLAREGPFDFALVQTGMTYWYSGVSEVIQDLRSYSPSTGIVLGGVYATLCPGHAGNLGADLVVHGSHLEQLWSLLDVEPDQGGLPFWEGYADLAVGVLKLAQGCPFRCTYCSVPLVDPVFSSYPVGRALAELDFLCRRGVTDVAFYDDALLYRPDKVLMPFLEGVRKVKGRVNFHTPNALNARFITRELAEIMVEGGFRTFYLGFESSAYDWQHRTGGKVYAHELARAVENLTAAGAERDAITAYLIIAHPNAGEQEVTGSMHFAHDLRIRIMLSEFSPIPGTPDGEECRRFVDLDEPLQHNKTLFSATYLGIEEVNRLKALSRALNGGLKSTGGRRVLSP